MGTAKPVGVVDFAYLEAFMAGDRAVVKEVLTLFLQQADIWAAGLDPANPEWRDAVHTIKGAARGIGAKQLGDICETTEAGDPSDLPAVRAGLEAALAEIAAYQART